MARRIPPKLAAAGRRAPWAAAWLERLPAVLADLERRWSLTLGPPFEGPDVSEAWVAPASRGDGASAVLKIGLPHMEAEHEIEGLRFWNGDPTVRVLDADDALGAMLLERCEPGTSLRTRPEAEQDEVIASLLRRLWLVPDPQLPFRPLSEMIRSWMEETRSNETGWLDRGLVLAGLEEFEWLIGEEPAPDAALLATDLHAGNVLRARREPWLVIDPKPFVGDRAYDATQHLLNCWDRLRAEPLRTIGRFADLLEVDAGRVRRWLFARTAAESRDDRDASWNDLARALAP